MQGGRQFEARPPSNAARAASAPLGQWPEGREARRVYFEPHRVRPGSEHQSLKTVAMGRQTGRHEGSKNVPDAVTS